MRRCCFGRRTSDVRTQARQSFELVSRPRLDTRAVRWHGVTKLAPKAVERSTCSRQLADGRRRVSAATTGARVHDEQRATHRASTVTGLARDPDDSLTLRALP